MTGDEGERKRELVRRIGIGIGSFGGSVSRAMMEVAQGWRLKGGFLNFFKFFFPEGWGG